MAASVNSTFLSVPSSSKKVLWGWQSNSDPSNDQQQKQWKNYSDLDCELIEGRYQKKQREVELGGTHLINFTRMVHMRKDNRHRTRRVKGEVIDAIRYTREERFCYLEHSIPQSFGYIDGCGYIDGYIDVMSQFIRDWKKKNASICDNEHVTTVVVQAAQAGHNMTENLFDEMLKSELFIPMKLHDDPLL
ncbi:unnamed protein product [Didymodactylos carnosus]|uniref:WWE domain-containing protein n=1 Tax=Didymodactylos carnosus TaxID=1234261 RepID=A0A814MLW5_9BILA|nr:unnamed protein product [Didymodactylos carnosus]CAF3846720.1 unnamed protein product [Didymodactylos carnosus]